MEQFYLSCFPLCLVISWAPRFLVHRRNYIFLILCTALMSMREHFQYSSNCQSTGCGTGLIVRQEGCSHIHLACTQLCLIETPRTFGMANESKRAASNSWESQTSEDEE